MAESFSGTLTPNVVTTVTLSGVAETVTVRADGTDSIWFTTDGSTPTANNRRLPRAAQGEVTVDVTSETDPTVVKLISPGAVAYRVSAATGGSQSGASVAATPFTTETMANPIGDGDISVLVFPAEGSAVLAVKVDGDAFPRWLLMAGNESGLYIGDGTIDVTQGANIWGHGADLHLGGRGNVVPDTDVIFDGVGPVLTAPDTSTHRIKVANDGSLSTEPVL